MNAVVRSAAAAVAAVALLPSLTAGSLAWGGAGHVYISRAAAQSFSATLPEFVRSAAAVDEIAALGPELDRSEDAGRSHDADIRPGHYVDVGDDGRIAKAIDLSALPATRRDYDAALRGAGTDQYAQGFLPYALIDGWQQIVKDFAIWRVDRIGERTATADAEKLYFLNDRALRETLTVRDIGVWSHYVGDASQPLHVTVHFNGWGDYPNPQAYTASHSLHARFEGEFVRIHASPDAVLAAMTPPALSTAPIGDQIAAYLRRTNAHVRTLYDLEKRGGFGDPASLDAIAFVDQRLADGASELRDLVAEAYGASDTMKVGYPDPITPLQAESGLIVPTRANSGASL